MTGQALEFYKDLFEEMDPDTFAARFLGVLLSLQGVDRGSVWVAEPDAYRCIEAAGDEADKIRGLCLPVDQPSIVGWVVRNRKMTVSEVASDQRQAKFVEKDLATKNNIILCFPLILKDGQVYGAVEIIDASHQGDRLNLDQDYLGLLSSLVDIGSIALGNALSFARQEQENQRLKHALKEAGSGEIVSQNQAFLHALKTARSYARTDFPVLITGESGTGKDLVAQEIHRLSARAGGPFLVQNCSAIPETLLESELFGHKKGAFTGAHRDRAGLFLAADGGSVFLDEIGDMPPNLQARILRVLQNGEVKPLGGSRTQKVDVRIIAATNRDLPQAMQQGGFRQGPVLPPQRAAPGTSAATGAARGRGPAFGLFHATRGCGPGPGAQGVRAPGPAGHGLPRLAGQHPRVGEPDKVSLGHGAGPGGGGAPPAAPSAGKGIFLRRRGRLGGGGKPPLTAIPGRIWRRHTLKASWTSTAGTSPRPPKRRE